MLFGCAYSFVHLFFLQVEFMEEEESNLIKELVAGLTKQLNDRMISPLLPSFIISWLIVNYKLIVTIFSDGPYETKLLYIDKILYPSYSDIFFHCALIPLISALLYIFVYPFPAKWVYQFALKRKRDLRKAKQEAENERLLTKVESQKLYSNMYDREQRFDKELQRQIEENNVLRAKVSELEKTISEQPNVVSTGLAPSNNKLIDNLSVDHISVLRTLSDRENAGSRGLNAQELAKELRLQVTDIQIVLGELRHFRYLTESSSQFGLIYTLTNDGRKVLKELLKMMEDIRGSDK
jgi:hypothetical protein